MTELIEAKKFGLDEIQAEEIKKGLSTILAERAELEKSYIDVISLEITEENIKVFSELRKKIQKNRTQGIEVWHKTNKEFYLRGGQFVDAIKKKESAVNEEMESKLMDAEKYFENLEKQRIAELQISRAEILSQYVEDAHERTLHSMDQDVWEAYLSAKKKDYEDRLEAERLAELARVEEQRLNTLEYQRRIEIAPFVQFIGENKDLRTMSDSDYSKLLSELQQAKADHEAEQEKIRLENERLRKEAEAKNEEARLKHLEQLKKEAKEREEREAEQAKIKAAHEAELKAERERQAKLEKEIQDRKDAELKAAKEAEEKRQAELAKGDSEKIKDLINDLTTLKSKYSFESKSNKEMYEKVGQLIDKVTTFINQ